MTCLIIKAFRLTPSTSAFESGGLTISCTVLYPEQFDALRRTYDCERSMIESLARCVKFDASGGKSGSAFLKTLGKFELVLTVACRTEVPDRRSVHCEGTFAGRTSSYGVVCACLFRLYVVCGDWECT